VVKIVGQGCGGLVDGSGFVVGSNLVVTNAHVVAGISRQFVVDSDGTHSATAIWFDPELDLAILRVANLAGQPLQLAGGIVPDKTAAVVLGYPGGGSFTANPASVLDQFTATGRDIYSRGVTDRSIYELAADIEPGNSGGPLVTADGKVIGVIFARSTTYDNVGYALTMDTVIDAISKASARNNAVDTGSCASE
jgi:S1-C subfamily serine protease